MNVKMHHYPDANRQSLHIINLLDLQSTASMCLNGTGFGLAVLDVAGISTSCCCRQPRASRSKCSTPCQSTRTGRKRLEACVAGKLSTTKVWVHRQARRQKNISLLWTRIARRLCGLVWHGHTVVCKQRAEFCCISMAAVELMCRVRI